MPDAGGAKPDRPAFDALDSGLERDPPSRHNAGTVKLPVALALSVTAAATFGKPPAAPKPPADIPTTAQLDAAFDALRVEEVAWRRIDWRTCLLDGLIESRRSSKPVLLWVFIDRPVDDKRC